MEQTVGQPSMRLQSMLHPFVVPLGLYYTDKSCFPMLAAVSHPAVHVVKFPRYFASDFDAVVGPMDFHACCTGC